MSKSFVTIRNFIGDPDKKTYGQIVREAVKCGIAERELPKHYFTRLLYKKGVDNYLDYMGVRTNNRLTASGVIHNHSMAPLFDNKLCFSTFMESKPEVKIPRVLGYNFKSAFFCKRQDKPEMMHELDAVMTYLEELLEDSPGEKVFIKPIDGKQGKNCFLLHRNDLREARLGVEHGERNSTGGLASKAGVNTDVSMIIDVLLQGSFLFQEVPEQQRDIAMIYPYSLNTMRIDTYLDSCGNISLMTGLMRFGTGGRVVDNISTGGIFVPVDMETGRLKQKAFQLLEHGGNIYVSHPDTGFVFEGFEVPFFQEVQEMLVALVRMLPDILLGWDVALTSEGPVIIEGSQWYSPRVSEMAYGGYKNHPVYQEILKRV